MVLSNQRKHSMKLQPTLRRLWDGKDMNSTTVRSSVACSKRSAALHKPILTLKCCLFRSRLFCHRSSLIDVLPLFEGKFTYRTSCFLTIQNEAIFGKDKEITIFLYFQLLYLQTACCYYPYETTMRENLK
jgi:hypothetical protein